MMQELIVLVTIAGVLLDLSVKFFTGLLLAAGTYCLVQYGRKAGKDAQRKVG